MDVYHPWGPIMNHQKEWHLDPLDDVPGSVEMIERCTFDVIRSRWIDEWIPVLHPENALYQSIRCYSPADFKLLLLDTKFELQSMVIDDQNISYETIELCNPNEMFKHDYNYLVHLIQKT